MVQTVTQETDGLEAVAGADGVWLQDQATNLMVINTVFTIDRIDVETMRRVFFERLLGDGDAYRYPRFARRVIQRGSRYYWQDDPEFDISRQIILAPGLEEDPRALDDKAKLQDYMGGVASQPLPSDRPLWQLQVIPRFGDDGSALICRSHHVLGDGIAMVQVLFGLMDSIPNEGMVVPAVVDRGGKPPNKLLLAAKASLAGPWILAQKMAWRSDRSSVHGPELTTEKRVAWTQPLELATIKAIKDHHGATVNDVLVACVAGAFRRYGKSRGEGLRQLQVSMPVNVRSSADKLVMDNKFAAVMLSLPVDIDDSVERIAETKRLMDQLKRSVEPVATFGIVNVMLKTLPFRWSAGLIDFFANKCTCVLSNVPGPQKPLYLAGRRLRAMLFWVPQRATVGIGVSLISFDGSLRMGVLADSRLVAEPSTLVEAFEAEVEELRRSLSDANGRSSGTR